MKPQELRIGNEVEWDDDSHEQVKVLSISYIMDDDGEITNYFINGGLIDDFLPIIPITPEWLEEKGFEKEGDQWIKRHTPEWMNIAIYDGSWVCSIFGSDTDWAYPCLNELVTQYRHQLQNLYFALTGKEL